MTWPLGCAAAALPFLLAALYRQCRIDRRRPGYGVPAHVHHHEETDH